MAQLGLAVRWTSFGNQLFCFRQPSCNDTNIYGCRTRCHYHLAQQKTAKLSNDKGRNNNEAEAFSDNITLDYEGLKGANFSETNKKTLLHLINQYVSNMTDIHAQVKMEEVEKHINETYFAWIGKTDDDAVFYYRIHSPVLLIEFDHHKVQ